jgi:putative transposase
LVFAFKRLQETKEFFIEIDIAKHLHEQYSAMLEGLMCYERQCFLNAHPYQRHDGRVDQANGFYNRRLARRAGTFELNVPRTRGGEFHSQVVPRFQRRTVAVTEAIKSPRARPAQPWPRCSTKR